MYNFSSQHDVTTEKSDSISSPDNTSAIATKAEKSTQKIIELHLAQKHASEVGITKEIEVVCTTATTAEHETQLTSQQQQHMPQDAAVTIEVKI